MRDMSDGRDGTDVLRYAGLLVGITSYYGILWQLIGCEVWR